MEYKVLKSFFDKNTGIGYNKGNTFSSEDADRVSFLSKEGFIEKPKEQVKKNASNRKGSTKDKA